MNIIQPVVLALIRKENKYLLTLRVDEKDDFNNMWQIPGGGLEFGETPEQATHREVREELGIEIEDLRMIPWIDTSVRGNWQGLFISFVCNLKDEEKKIILNEESSEYRWVTLDEAKQLPILKGCIEILSEAEKI